AFATLAGRRNARFENRLASIARNRACVAAVRVALGAMLAQQRQDCVGKIDFIGSVNPRHGSPNESNHEYPANMLHRYAQFKSGEPINLSVSKCPNLRKLYRYFRTNRIRERPPSKNEGRERDFLSGKTPVH